MLRQEEDEAPQLLKTAPASESLKPDQQSAGAADRTTPAAPVEAARDPLSMRASDLMSSPAIVASTEEPVSSVARRMLETGVNGMPVVDAAGVPVGMVCDGDLIGRRGDQRDDWWLEILAKRSPLGAGAPLPDLDRAVHEVMTSPLITIAHTASLKDVAEALHTHRIKRLPVLEQGRLVGIVSRTDLIRLAKNMPRPTPAKGSGGNGFLDFLESMIGGASLRGAPERPAALRNEEPRKEEKPAPSILSAAVLRDEVHAYKAEIVDHKQASAREAQLERQRQVKVLLDHHVTDEFWRERLDHAKLAARSGELEMVLVSFPADLCTDGGRKIDVAEEGWEGTLRGEAAEIYDRWRIELKEQGFGLSARIVSFQEDGTIGDLGLFLTWGE